MSSKTNKIPLNGPFIVFRGEHLRLLRTQLQWGKPINAAAKFCIDESTWKRWEKGTTIPPATIMIILAIWIEKLNLVREQDTLPPMRKGAGREGATPLSAKGKSYYVTKRGRSYEVGVPQESLSKITSLITELHSLISPPLDTNPFSLQGQTSGQSVQRVNEEAAWMSTNEKSNKLTSRIDALPAEKRKTVLNALDLVIKLAGI